MLVAQDPRTGFVSCELETTGFNTQGGSLFDSGLAVHLLREYAALKEAKK